ncbi:amino acid transporter [Helicobacter muridarum]|uniref:Amino acid transporter n=1 Tax=Helicobacter muridarum TaxID=216 RepID=A0A4U8TL21_9HELI|nr:amino acid transporter [Helicobacter muridarum]
MEYFIKGLLLSFSLIVAIGAQNLFILKQGILNNHIFWVCFVCFACDVLLMCFGIFGVGVFLADNKTITILLGLCGTCFVAWYGVSALISVYRWKSQTITNDNNPRMSLQKTIIQTLIVTLINPHVYIDSLIIIGAFGLSLNLNEKLCFAFGAVSASGIWFFSLGFLANKARKYFRNLKIWLAINIMVAIIMFNIAYGLLIFSIDTICSIN